MLPRPLAFAFSIGRSPACPLPGAPWGLPVGLKCPFALEASGALQSPTSWMCTACCAFGLSPWAKRKILTLLSPVCSNVASPMVLLPEAGLSCAGARGGSSGVVWQPARRAAEMAMESSGLFIRILLPRILFPILPLGIRRTAPVSLVVRNRAILRLGQVLGRPGLRGGRLLRLGGLLGLALGRRGRKFRVGSGQDAEHRAGGKRGNQALHDSSPVHDPSFMCGAPAGTAPPAAVFEIGRAASRARG